jgi:hypothetical protein
VRLWLCVPIALGALLLATPAGADFRTGLMGYPSEIGSAAARGPWLAEAGAAGASVIRVPLSWREVATRPPRQALDPADPGYDWSYYDAAIIDIVAHGFQPLLTIGGSPDFAAGPDRPTSINVAAWMPTPESFGDFATAAARRYSGAFEGLPRVHYFEAWNEPNLTTFLAPQWNGKRAIGAERYRALVADFYAGVKGVDPTNVVIAGSQGPFGDDPNSGFGRVRPVRFLRAMLCLKPNLEPTGSCPQMASFDVLSHHPIDPLFGPTYSAASPEDATTPDMGRLERVLRAAERAGTVGGPRRHRMWATEIWWESNPPDPNARANLTRQARWVQQSLYLLWRSNVEVVINLPLVDQVFADVGFAATLQSGLVFTDGRRKPSFRAFRFPLVADRRSKDRLFVWGIAPRGGKTLEIQRRAHGRWDTVRSLKPRAGKVFTTILDSTGPEVLRARIGGDHSLRWKQRR